MVRWEYRIPQKKLVCTVQYAEAGYKVTLGWFSGVWLRLVRFELFAGND